MMLDWTTNKLLIKFNIERVLKEKEMGSFVEKERKGVLRVMIDFF